MHTRNIILATFSLTTVAAIPIINPSTTSVEPRGLLDGLLGPGGLLGGLLGSVPSGGTDDAVGDLPDRPSLDDATGGLPEGLGLDNLFGGLLSPDDGLIGSLLEGLGINGETGIIGGLLGGGLLGGGGGKSKFPGLDPSKQKPKPGTVKTARPQDGFTFKNIEVYSPKAGLLDLLLQLLLGGKKTMWLTRTLPDGSGVKTISGEKFKVNATSVKAICFSNDITTTIKWLPIACNMTVSGFVEGKSIGALQPQTVNTGRRTTTASKAVTSLEKLDGVAKGEELEVDEVRMAFTPPAVKEGGKSESPIKSVMLRFNFQIQRT